MTSLECHLNPKLKLDVTLSPSGIILLGKWWPLFAHPLLSWLLPETLVSFSLMASIPLSAQSSTFTPSLLASSTSRCCVPQEPILL